MKKVRNILAVIICTIVFTSCTDETDKTIELIELENELEIFAIDKKDAISPNGGSTGGADYDEE